MQLLIELRNNMSNLMSMPLTKRSYGTRNFIPTITPQSPDPFYKLHSQRMQFTQSTTKEKKVEHPKMSSVVLRCSEKKGNSKQAISA